MSENSLQTFISLPVVNKDAVLRDLLVEADKRPDAMLWVANIDTRSLIHINNKFENWSGYSVTDAMNGGTEYLFNILDESTKPEVFARLASYNAFSRQENFDPRNLLIQEIPYVIKTKSGNKANFRQVGSMLTFTGSQEPEFFVGLWTKENSPTIGQCLEHLVRIKLRHNEIYSHIPFRREQSLLNPVYITKSRNNILSKREQEVIKLLSQGYSTKEIAEQLQISFNTIETHRKHLLQKFEAKNVAELIKKATKIFWLE